MREIKFRAWNGESKEMMKVIRMTFNGKVKCYDRLLLGFCGESDDINVMQFTGLKDKNGKEIYEGDVVMALETDVIGYIEFFNGSLMWTDGACYWDLISCKEVYSIKKCKNSEVIGNIYENPELLEESK